ncbi:hypothetical protein SBV1_1000005 [Verrucomicrobia bacterium]|nr:hypothetical protein SBV1_1000005 [Verrucomicrobiota bacterium]
MKRTSLGILRGVPLVKRMMMSQKDDLNTALLVGDGLDLKRASVRMVDAEDVL